MAEHQEFEQLCALYTAGGLPDEQVKQLDEHLEVCLDCRRVLQEFHEVASMGLPSLAPDFAALPITDKAGWVPQRAQHRLLARIHNEILARVPSIADGAPQSSADRTVPNQSSRSFHNVRNWLRYAVALLAIGVISLYSYHVGMQKVASVSEPKLKKAELKLESQRQEFATLRENYEALASKLRESDTRIGSLGSELKWRLAEIGLLREELKKQEKQLQDTTLDARASQVASETERAAISHRLAQAQISRTTLERQLETARNERETQVQQMAALERRLNDASTLLTERDQTIREQQDLLAYDRDIRDLIGARDLYVAEVRDVGRNAETQKPFGRVFFTKGKSLIFYAYDLDRQPGLRPASTFQAWGRRGPNFSGSLPLGIMYLDAHSNKRWVLKFDDPTALAKIDAVFVTVEPQGGSRKPTTKPLLFAYLKVEPNHP